MEKEVITNFTSGMLTVPQELQASLRLREGSQLLLRVENGELIAHPLVSQPIDVEKALAVIESFRGILAGPQSLSDELVKMRAEEEEFQERKWSL